jgi:hypothetical protein
VFGSALRKEHAKWQGIWQFATDADLNIPRQSSNSNGPACAYALPISSGAIHKSSFVVGLTIRLCRGRALSRKTFSLKPMK